jgi:cellulose biosynthesis protein BcsQ
MAGLLSSHGVVTPCTADMLGICTLPITLASLARAMAINPALVHLGFLITRYDHREMAQRDCEQLLRRTYGRQVLTTISPACAEFGQANSCRIPVQQFKPKGKAAKAAREIWAELTDRMADHHTTTRRKTA